jgi:hypothetical protein
MAFSLGATGFAVREKAMKSRLTWNGISMQKMDIRYGPREYHLLKCSLVRLLISRGTENHAVEITPH